MEEIFGIVYWTQNELVLLCGKSEQQRVAAMEIL